MISDKQIAISIDVPLPSKLLLPEKLRHGLICQGLEAVIHECDFTLY